MQGAKNGRQKAGVRSQASEDRNQEGGGGSIEAGRVPCEGCGYWRDIRKRIRVAELLGTAITKLKERFAADDFKPSVADYLKLVELEQELEQSSETVKEIKVTWVESSESDSER